jgi:protein-L-isoaspartate(D-aspartate) O-methyltransferase
MDENGKSQTKKFGGQNQFEHARELMVQRQIEARGIRDRKLLQIMQLVPRHMFVPFSEIKSAYKDSPLPIGYEQTISQPYIVAYMTDKLALQGGEKVLEIGTGSGYQTAILSRLAGIVYSIEIVEQLYQLAISTLAVLGYSNVQVRCGDGFHGWPELAPFDAIIMTAAAKDIPQPLLDQLAPGGRFIAPIGESTQELILVTKDLGNTFKKEKLIPVRFVPMTGRAKD